MGQALPPMDALKGNALRHQIVLPQQQAFYDYWRSKCRGGRIPSRHDIDPGEMGSFLSMVTLTERCPSADSVSRYRIRLAGTGFWRFYGSEIQGRYIDELPIGCRTDYFTRVLNMVCDQGRPFHGVTKPNTPIGSHMAQFWLRLPLSEDGESVNCILGYDHIAPLERAVQPLAASEKLLA